jgi:hypothetical protein
MNPAESPLAKFQVMRVVSEQIGSRLIAAESRSRHFVAEIWRFRPAATATLLQIGVAIPYSTAFTDIPRSAHGPRHR